MNFSFEKLPRSIAIALLILSSLGILDAGYLTVTHYLDASTICLTADQCDLVLESSYATVAGIPISVFGLLYYASVLFLTILYLRTPEKGLWWLLAGVVSAAFLVSAYLVGLQMFVIHALCTYCLVSAFLTALLFLTVGMGTFNFYLQGNSPDVSSET